MHMTQTSILLLTDLGQIRKAKTFFCKDDSIIIGHNSIKQAPAESRRNCDTNTLLVDAEEIACDRFTQYLNSVSQGLLNTEWMISLQNAKTLSNHITTSHFLASYAAILNMQTSLFSLILKIAVLIYFLISIQLQNKQQKKTVLHCLPFCQSPL